jgi:hypothetical protein
MKKIIIGICILLPLAFVVDCLALDKFVNYRNYSSAQNDDVPVTPDQNYAISQGYINTYSLTANANKAVTAPTGAKFALFNANADIWVNVGGVAAVPSGDTTDGSGSELNPMLRYIGANTTIGVISESAAKVSIMFYE